MISALKDAGLKRVATTEPMSHHTTWKVGGPADYFAVAETPDSLSRAILVAREQGIPWIVLGGGSNILVSDEGVEGLVILNRIKGIRLVESKDGAVAEVGSGAFFAWLAQYTAKRNYGGLEWGVAIPGTIGAGVVNNAGAHHGDVQRTLKRAEALDQDGNAVIMGPDELSFAYRESQLKRTDGTAVTQTEMVITRAWFRTHRVEAGSATRLLTELMERRKATQPVSQASAGSTFKNPNGLSAGALLERAGLKGSRIGGAEFSSKHANFIVNSGSATAADIVELVRVARREVARQSGVDLQPEVQLVGRWAEEHPLNPEIPMQAGAQ